ncbi:MAG: hypothetical protein QM523_00430 [Candidatus Pacebacteria bacterium]|nr:hypothetical protein [Candidatus Paceibacterota bacterium]
MAENTQTTVATPPASKKPAGDKASYQVLTPIDYNGAHYQIDDTIDLPLKDATPLLNLAAIAELSAESK